MEHGQLTKNTVFILIASIIQKIGAFIFFVLLARFLGADNVGKFVFAFAFTGIFGIFSDSGLSSILNREVAKNKEKGAEYFNVSFSFKIIFALISYLLVVIFINLFRYPFSTKIVVYLAGITVILESFITNFTAFLKGLQRLKYESFFIVIREMLLITFTGVALYYFKSTLWVVLIFYIAFSILALLYYLIIINKKTDLKIKLNFDKKILFFLLKVGLIFTSTGILSQFFWNVDKILLSKIVGDAAVGIYSISYKLIFALQFIPLALGSAIFPAFSYCFVNDKEKLLRTFEKAFHYLTIIAIPISFGTYFLADKIILKIYGNNFLTAIAPLKILITSLFFFFMIFLWGALLNACEKHRENMINWIIILALNILLNSFLIPQYKAVGASVAFIISMVVLFFLSLREGKKVLTYRKKLTNILLKAIFSGILMSIFIFYFKEKLSVFIAIPLAGLIYFAVLYLLKGIKKEDFLGIKESIGI